MSDVSKLLSKIKEREKKARPFWIHQSWPCVEQDPRCRTVEDRIFNEPVPGTIPVREQLEPKDAERMRMALESALDSIYCLATEDVKEQIKEEIRAILAGEGEL